MGAAPKHYYRKISLGFLSYDVWVCTGMPSKEMVKVLKRKLRCGDFEFEDCEEKTDMLGFACHITGTRDLAIWLRHPPIGHQSISTLAHEALHIVARVCTDTGIPFVTQNDETLCYMLDAIITPVLEDWFDFKIFGKGRLAKGKKLGTLNPKKK